MRVKVVSRQLSQVSLGNCLCADGFHLVNMSATESAQTFNSESMSGDEENNMAWTKLAKTAQPKTRKEACNSSCSGRYLENKNTDGSEVC